VPTPEDKRPSLRSIYALNKYAQERMSLLIGEAYGIPTIALRLFNVYGTRQALSNPYTGVLAIFAARLLNGDDLGCSRTARSAATSSMSATSRVSVA
jgi:dTDP-L-rhamnose 4-epimerase